MSGNHERSGSPSDPPQEGGRAISTSAPPTDDLDSEWDSSPAEAAPEKPAEKPSVRPGSVVVRTSPPPPMALAPGADAGNTLLGVAPPAVASQAAKPAVTAIPRAAAVPAEAKLDAPEAAASVTPEVPPASLPEVAAAPPTAAEAEPPNVDDRSTQPGLQPPEAKQSSERPAEKSEPTAKAQPVVAAKAEPAPVKERARAAPARATDGASSPDSVAASSSDRPSSGIQDEPVAVAPQRSSRGLVIAAAAAIAIFGLWYGLRGGASGESAKAENAPPAPIAQVSKAEPAPAETLQQPTPQAAAPAEPAPLPAATAEPGAAPSGAEPAAPAADGKKVVIVKVRPAGARFYHKGKKMGGSPMRVELAPGEKRAFEVGHPDFVTRKVVIDGSEPEVIVGLHPKSAPRKAPATEPAQAPE